MSRPSASWYWTLSGVVTPTWAPGRHAHSSAGAQRGRLTGRQRGFRGRPPGPGCHRLSIVPSVKWGSSACLPPPAGMRYSPRLMCDGGREQSPQVLGPDCLSHEPRFLPKLTSADHQLFVSFKQSYHKPLTPKMPGTHYRADKHQILPHSVRKQGQADPAWGRGLFLAPGKGERGAGDTRQPPWRFPGPANHL